MAVILAEDRGNDFKALGTYFLATLRLKCIVCNQPSNGRKKKYMSSMCSSQSLPLRAPLLGHCHTINGGTVLNCNLRGK